MSELTRRQGRDQNKSKRERNKKEKGERKNFPTRTGVGEAFDVPRQPDWVSGVQLDCCGPSKNREKTDNPVRKNQKRGRVLESAKQEGRRCVVSARKRCLLADGRNRSEMTKRDHQCFAEKVKREQRRGSERAGTKTNYKSQN